MHRPRVQAWKGQLHGRTEPTRHPARDLGRYRGWFEVRLPPRSRLVLPSLHSSGINARCPVRSGQSTADRAVWGEGLGGAGWPEFLTPGAGLQPCGLASCFCCRSCLPLLRSLRTLTSQSPAWISLACGPRDSSTTGQMPACQQARG